MDYEKMVLKSGLEIHQQLNTNKLFCNCPSLLRNDEPKFKAERKLNPVVGETGEIDSAAAYEKSKDKKFVYEFYDTNCLVELDEEPPHEINHESLKIALQICELMNCQIFPVTQIMRKTVIDGSNTSGFQRTVLIGHDGFIETSVGKVGIETIALEEDAARKISSDEKTTTYRLDRLGIPLVEITTKPDLKSPEQIKEAALKIGEILRACNVKRGIGTIRQDVNVSIKGLERVEIKGFQDTKIMLKTIDTEIERQQECLKNKSCKKEVRKTNPDGTTTFLRPMPGAARMYPETDHPLLKISRDMINEAKANLPKLTSEHKSYLAEFGLNDELVKVLLKQNKLEEFKELLTRLNNPQLIVKILTIYRKELLKKNQITEEEYEKKLSADILENILDAVKESKISENDVKPVMQQIIDGKTIEDAMSKADIDLANEVKKLAKEKPGLSDGAYMGIIMGKFKGQVSGKEVMEELKKQKG
ncbi:Glu-tRNA(Gln) amidotransferase subunit GatE [archaeon]|nr:Glu-tRNA(Gln) amidotransferase subunit GatE [archaeon]